MNSFEELAAMSDQEVADLNRRLVRKLVINKIIVPIAITAVVHVAVNYIVKRIETNEDN